MVNEVSRRSLLAGLVTSGMLAMIEEPSVAARGKAFFERVGLPIGLQLYTLGDEVRRDLDAVLARVAEIGYHDIELPNLYGRDPEVIRAAADRAGLKISSLHMHVLAPTTGKAAGLSLLSEPARIADALGMLGVDQIVLPIMLFPENMRIQPGQSMKDAITQATAEGGESIWKRTAAFLNERAASLKPHGIRLAYHNHNLEFAPAGNGTGWDILLRETDADLVSFEVDTAWVAAAGLDPVAFLKGLRGRVSKLHVKDLKPTAANFAMMMEPSEVGMGQLDWARILPEAHAAGARHFYVEQEPPFSIPRIEAVRRSYAFLEVLRA